MQQRYCRSIQLLIVAVEASNKRRIRFREGHHGLLATIQVCLSISLSHKRVPASPGPSYFTTCLHGQLRTYACELPLNHKGNTLAISSKDNSISSTIPTTAYSKRRLVTACSPTMSAFSQATHPIPAIAHLLQGSARRWLRANRSCAAQNARHEIRWAARPPSPTCAVSKARQALPQSACRGQATTKLRPTFRRYLQRGKLQRSSPSRRVTHAHSCKQPHRAFTRRRTSLA